MNGQKDRELDELMVVLMLFRSMLEKKDKNKKNIDGFDEGAVN